MIKIICVRLLGNDFIASGNNDNYKVEQMVLSQKGVISGHHLTANMRGPD